MYEILMETPSPFGGEGFLFDLWRILIDTPRWTWLAEGLAVTLQITAGAILLGLTLGMILALMRISRFWPLRWLATAYITLFRGTPIVSQLFIWWFVIFMPMGADRMLVAIIAFGANSAAYCCEIFRGGIMSLDKGQTEAGRSVGLSSFQNFRHIVLPQALKNSLAPLSNELADVLKTTSVVGFIAVNDLQRQAHLILTGTFNAPVPLLVSAAIYFMVIALVTWLLSLLERRLRKGDLR